MNRLASAMVAVVAFFGVSAVHAVPVSPVDRAAGALVSYQKTAGYWPTEADYCGPVVSGLANAYLLTGNASYLNSAVKGGSYLLTIAPSGFLGDEAYALSRLSRLSADPADNQWRTAVSSYYQTVAARQGGTSGYINELVNYYLDTFDDRSQAVVYIAHHVLAAHEVGAADELVWRQRLVSEMAKITDNDSYPVMSLASALWALAGTGGLDDTLVTTSATGLWAGVRLCDLPDLLMSHYIASGDRAGSFYYRFDHAGASGYTEDLAFGILGLQAANDWQYDPQRAMAIAQGRQALIDHLPSTGGKMSENLWTGGTLMYAYTGEALMAVPEPVTLLTLLTGGAALLRRRRTN